MRCGQVAEPPAPAQAAKARTEAKTRPHRHVKRLNYVLCPLNRDTAYRDILDLMERGALKKNPGGGRSTSYDLADA